MRLCCKRYCNLSVLNYNVNKVFIIDFFKLINGFNLGSTVTYNGCRASYSIFNFKNVNVT